MEFLYMILSIFLIYLSLYSQSTHSQQEYINNDPLDCTANSSTTRGYRCNGLQTLCQSFITFLSRPPYASAVSIAYLLGSEASSIVSINNISSTTEEIPSGELIIVPVPCSCSGSIYQHTTTYTVKGGDTYFTIANKTYQGLTTCQAMVGQNYYVAENLNIGDQLGAPLKCACPSANQTANGVTSLLVYMVTWDDSITSIGETFGVSEQSILDANMLSSNSIIFPFTFILVPLDTRNCSASTEQFFCSCPNGFLADGSLGGLKCISDAKKFPVKLVSLIGVGIGAGFLCLFISGYQLFRYLKKRRYTIRKQKLFRQNGGFLLQQKFSSLGSSQKATVFTAEELHRATDNYNQSRFLGQGGYGTVYKGMLPDGSTVAVKRSKEIDRSWIEQFINEVFILSQISHRNIVKLLGCCLETEVPLLVYEFVPNGTLSSHIHDQDLESSLSWENRLRIACEVAGAVAYMHAAASVPIFHRDIKSSNILLDDKYSSKVSDFGTSRSIPLDKTHLTTAVQGTFGYLDPEYFQSSQFTEKSDVYSFGVVLVELLTGEKPISFARDEELRNLVAHFISSIKEDRLLQILDPRVAKEGDRDEILAVAGLAKRCLRYNGKKRPTMKEVAMELERLRESQTVLQVNGGSQIWSAESSVMDTVDEAEEEPLEDGIFLEMDSASI